MLKETLKKAAFIPYEKLKEKQESISSVQYILYK